MGRTRAVKAFFIARPAAFLTCKRALSLPRTDESINMYSGYKAHAISREKMGDIEDRHSFPEQRSQAFRWRPDACSHLEREKRGDIRRGTRRGHRGIPAERVFARSSVALMVGRDERGRMMGSKDLDAATTHPFVLSLS